MKTEKEKLFTSFAPAEREDMMHIRRQAKAITEDKLLISILDGISVGVVILNKTRQVVFANQAFLDLSQARDLQIVLGQRVGEAVGCLHAFENPGGCGTTPFCKECGAVRAILSALVGFGDVEECRITLDEDQRALDLRVTTIPIEIDGDLFTLFSIEDIGDEKRRQVLEHVFLHDAKNTAAGLSGLADLLNDSASEDLPGIQALLKEFSQKMLEEIESYRQLVMAENKELRVHTEEMESGKLLREIASLYRNHEVGRRRELRVHPQSENLSFRSDPVLLYRVVGNMVKNALEAVSEGETVTLHCFSDNGDVCFEVHNPGVIPADVRLQIFQRSFTTKGTGRGLGTYSIRLLGEKYLGGRVGFRSSDEEGTVFYGIFPLDSQIFGSRM